MTSVSRKTRATLDRHAAAKATGSLSSSDLDVSASTTTVTRCDHNTATQLRTVTASNTNHSTPAYILGTG